ncbi:hypothetical protein F5Y11DRAFT_350156 [Daldinia sp. FL1419]|nr:hypothetical protein F5Y11DRAFT_350156 [Daldinia sp. FL1419]
MTTAAVNVVTAVAAVAAEPTLTASIKSGRGGLGEFRAAGGSILHWTRCSAGENPLDAISTAKLRSEDCRRHRRKESITVSHSFIGTRKRRGLRRQAIRRHSIDDYRIGSTDYSSQQEFARIRSNKMPPPDAASSATPRW